MRKFSKSGITLAAILTGVSVFAAGADSLEGRWDATLTVKATVIPFRLDISGSGANFKGTLYNGDEKEFTTNAKFENGKLVLDFAHYLTTITATANDGQLTGKVDQRNGEVGGSACPSRSVHVAPPAVSAADVPSIEGVWDIPFEVGKKSPKGEKAWRRNRQAERCRSVGCNSSRRRRHWRAHRNLPRRQVRAEPLRRLSPGPDANHRSAGRNAPGRADRQQPQWQADRLSPGGRSRQGAA